MPYIDKKRRDVISTPETAGELNFMITELMIAYIRNNGVSYQVFNDIIGACEGAKLEFYRRVVVKYEQTKIETNGDVYDKDLLSAL